MKEMAQVILQVKNDLNVIHFAIDICYGDQYESTMVTF